MSKRFCDTEIFKKKWFRKLPSKYKTMFFYLFTNCDLAGIWDVDFEQVSFFVDRTVTEEKCLQLFEKHIMVIEPSKKWFLLDFIPFQYGDQLNEKSPVHKKIIDILSKYSVNGHTLYHTLYDRVSDTAKEEEEEKDKEEEKEITEKGSGEKPSRKPKLIIKNDDSKKLKAEYTALLENNSSLPIKELWILVKTFIENNKPKFIDPYVDAWNIVANNYKLSKVDSISDTRIKKFNTRIKEAAFDFLKVLEQISKSAFLKGNVNGWKVDFDWILENDTQYLQIIEGKYSN